MAAFQETPPDMQQRGSEMLELLRRTRTALLLTLPSSELVYTSRLLKIHRDHLQIDQLIPLAGDKLLEPGLALRLRASRQGVGYWFKAQHLGTSVDDRGFPYHRITRPAQVQSQDKRASFRVLIDRANSPDCRIATGSGEAGHAGLEDISEGGACLRMIADRAPSRIGDALDFTVEFNPHGALECGARVCYLQRVPRSNLTRVGVSFRGLSLQQVKSLRRIIMWLQRHSTGTGGRR